MIRRADRVPAAQLHDRGVPIKAAENALILATPLGAIRSLAYFLPVINEVLQLRHLIPRLTSAPSVNPPFL